MNGVSFSATTENRKGILLDPRTKARPIVDDYDTDVQHQQRRNYE